MRYPQLLLRRRKEDRIRYYPGALFPLQLFSKRISFPNLQPFTSLSSPPTDL